VEFWENLKKLSKDPNVASGHVISPYPKLPLVLLQLDRNNTHIFCFLNIYYKPAGTTFL